MPQFLSSLATLPPGGPLHGAADLLIWMAVIAVPLALVARGRRQDRPLRRVFTLLAVCATGGALAHALRAAVPGHWAGGAAPVAAAVTAWVTALVLLRLLPPALHAVARESHAGELERLRLLEAAIAVCEDGIIIAAPVSADIRAPRIVFANRAFERLTGYHPAEVVGQSPTILPEADGLDGVRAALQAAGPTRLELRSRRKDGTSVWAEWHIVPLAGASGRTAHWVAVLRDTTAHRRAQDDLRQARDFLTSVLENVPAAVTVTDARDRCLFVNSAWEKATRITRDRAVGKRTADLFPPPVVADIRRLAEAVRAAGKPVRGERTVDFGGGPRVILSVAFPLPGRDDQAGQVGEVAIDLTEQKRAEEAVRSLNAELKRRVEEAEALVELSPVGIAVVNDPSGCGVEVNRALRELLGLPPEADPELTPAATRLRVRFRRGGREVPHQELPIQRCLARGEAVDGAEFEITRPDGGERVVVNSVRPLFGDGGQVRGCVSVYTDITDRVLAGRALRESEEQFRRVFEDSPIGIYRAALDGRVLMANPAAVRMVGLGSAAEFPSRGWAAAPPAAGDRGDELRGEEFSWQRPDGSVITVRENSRAVRGAGGGVVYFEGTLEDVTERRRAEERLREREALLRGVIAHIPCGVFWKDRDSVYLGCNDQVARDHGLSGPDQVVGRTDFELGVAAAEAASYQECDRRVIDSGEPIVNLEEAQTRSGGTHATLLTSKVPLRDATGRVAGVLGVYQDITERKRGEEALRRSEARKAAILETALDCVITMDHEGNVVEFNTAAERTFGYHRAEVVGKQLAHMIIPPSLRERHRVGMAHYLATGEGAVMGRRLEFPAMRADGTEFPAELAVTRIPADGPPLFTAYLRDITDQKRAEAERADLLARLTLQIERMPLAYLLSGPDFRYTGWNPAAERTFGFTRAEALGRHPFEVVVPPQSHAVVAGVFARLAAGDMDAHGVCENVTRDGRAITCEWHNTPLFGPDGTFQGVLSLAQDVTARRRAEEELHLRDRAIHAVVGGVVITDPTRPGNPITYASPGFERLTGYTGAEVAGRNCRLLQGPGTDPQAAAEVRAAVRDARPCDVELLNYRKDGTPFWNHLQVSPVRDDAGRVTHFVGVQTDVTGRRALEDQFRQAQKMDAVGRLAGGVAHDFNNLLTVINGYGDMVYDALPPGHPSRELVEEITKAGERAAGLTRQLLAFSRQSVLEPKVLDPNALVRGVEKMLRRLIGEDIDLATRLPPDVGRVKADPGQLEQAVVNLCVNARDAMPTGGKLTVETRNVDLGAAHAAADPDVRPGPYVVLSVTDTGAGMTPEVRARIFEPFFTTKEQGKGTGLGLAMVFGFVKQSGGHITVYSEPGRGAAFKLYLPRLREVPAAGKSGAHRRPMPRGAETVLLVEDEDSVRALGRHVLVSCGYTVLEASNGPNAVRAMGAHAGPLDVLVTDVVMPGGMGGRQVAEAVAARHPGAKVLFTSGYTDDAVVRHGVLEEGTHFLQKPFTPATLAQKVRDVLDGTGGRGGA